MQYKHEILKHTKKCQGSNEHKHTSKADTNTELKATSVFPYSKLNQMY